MHADLAALSDDELVALCRDRGNEDDRPFTELFRRHNRLVWWICYRYFGNREDAGDLTQDVFFKAYRHLGGFTGGHPALFPAWLARVTANACKNELRRRSRRPRTSSEVSEPMMAKLDRPSIEETLVERDREALMLAALTTLPVEQRQILELADLGQRPLAAIAEDLDLSLSAVKMRALRARTALAAAYRALEATGGSR